MSRAGIRDPGNAGTVLRTADAAGATTVVFAGDAVDPYNGKCVRSSAGSLFHVDVVRVTVLAATGHGESDLDELVDAGRLAAPTAWLFGSEAHGLPVELAERRRPGPGAAARAGREPQPGCGGGRLPVRFGQSTALTRGHARMTEETRPPW